MKNRDHRNLVFPARQYSPAALAAGIEVFNKTHGVRAANDAAEAAMQEAASAPEPPAAPAATKDAPASAPIARNDNPSERILGARFGGSPNGQPHQSVDRTFGNPATTPAAARILAARFGAA